MFVNESGFECLLVSLYRSRGGKSKLGGSVPGMSTSGLRLVTKWMCEKASILSGERICDDCRKILGKIMALQTPDSYSVYVPHH